MWHLTGSIVSSSITIRKYSIIGLWFENKWKNVIVDGYVKFNLGKVKFEINNPYIIRKSPY